MKCELRTKWGDAREKREELTTDNHFNPEPQLVQRGAVTPSDATSNLPKQNVIRCWLQSWILSAFHCLLSCCLTNVYLVICSQRPRAGGGGPPCTRYLPMSLPLEKRKIKFSSPHNLWSVIPIFVKENTRWPCLISLVLLFAVAEVPGVGVWRPCQQVGPQSRPWKAQRDTTLLFFLSSTDFITINSGYVK